jgi:hypothetical protein
VTEALGLTDVDVRWAPAYEIAARAAMSQARLRPCRDGNLIVPTAARVAPPSTMGRDRGRA